MRTMQFITAALTLCLFAGSGFAEQPWQKEYTGEDATGAHVIALWSFNADAPGRDASGKYVLAPRGQSRFVAEGKFGGGLESFNSGKDPNTAQGATTKKNDALTPKGAFTFECWMKPKADLFESGTAFIFDNKYYHYNKDLPVAKHGFCLFLNRNSKKTAFRLAANLGFGDKSEAYQSAEVPLLQADTWCHLAMTYDGKGTVRFFVDGKDVGGRTAEGAGDLSPSLYHTALASRFGSTHVGCSAVFDQVRLSKGVIAFAPAD